MAYETPANKQHKTKDYSTQLPGIRSAIEEYYTHHNYELGTTEGYFEKLVKAINTFQARTTVTTSYVCDLYNGTLTSRKQRIAPTEALISFLKHFKESNTPAHTPPDTTTEITELKAQVKQLQVSQEALQKTRQRDAQLSRQYQNKVQNRIAPKAQLENLRHEVKQVIELTPALQQLSLQQQFKNNRFGAYHQLLENYLKQTAQTAAPAFYLKAKGYEAELQYEKALNSYRAAQVLDATNPLYLHGLGHFLYFIGQVTEAIPFLQQSAKYSDSAPQLTHLHCATLASLCSAHQALNQHKPAVEIAQKCIALCLKDYPTLKYELATCYNTMGLCYITLHDYKKANTNFEKALHILWPKNGAPHRNAPNTISNIGLLHAKQQQYAEALVCYQKAHEVNVKWYGKQHQSNAVRLTNLGEVYRHLAKYTQAKKHFEDAINIYKTVYPNGHMNWAGTLNNLANVYNRLGKNEKAIELFNDAIVMSQILAGKNNITAAHAYNNLGMLYTDNRQFELSLRHFLYAQEMYAAIFDSTHFTVAHTYSNICNLYIQKKNFTEAKKYYNLAFPIFKALKETKSLAALYLQISRASIYAATNKPSQSIKLLLQVAEDFKKTIGLNNEGTAICLHHIARVYQNTRHLAKAKEYYQLALRMFKAIASPTSIEAKLCKKEYATYTAQLKRK